MADKLADEPASRLIDHSAIHAPSVHPPLTLLIGGSPVGRVRVDRSNIDKVWGTLEPGPGFEPFRPVFEAAVQLSRQIDASSDSGVVSYPAWDRLMDAYTAIHRLGPVFAEFPMPIEEFAIDGDWSVEVTFVETRPQ